MTSPPSPPTSPDLSGAHGAAVPTGNRATVRRSFREGYIASLPFILVTIPLAVLFGVVAKDAGLDILQVMAMSIVVIAGSSQFAAVALMQEQAPVFIVIAAALAVNLRMAMYSAALQPHMGRASLRARMLIAYAMVDQTFALSLKTFEARPAMSMAEKIGYYFGCVVCVCPFWYAGCGLGAVIGQAVPPELSLDFAVPICFIAVLAPMLRSLPHIAAAIASSVATVIFGGLPWNLALPLAGMVGMITGAQMEIWRARQIARAASEGREEAQHD